MAFKAGEAFVEFTGKDTSFASATGRMHTSLGKLQVKMEKVAHIGRRMGLALGAAIGGVVYQSANFEQAMARVRALTGATETDFAALEKTAKDLGRATVFTAKQAAEGMGFFALAGFEANEIIAAMPATTNLAAAGQLEMGQAADIAAKIMAGKGLTSSELTHAVDVLSKSFT